MRYFADRRLKAQLLAEMEAQLRNLPDQPAIGPRERPFASALAPNGLSAPGGKCFTLADHALRLTHDPFWLNAGWRPAIGFTG